MPAALSAYSVDEKAGIIILTVSRSGGFDGAVAVQYDVSLATSLRIKSQAAPGTDFNGELHGTVTFNAGGATLASKGLPTVTILNDDLLPVANATPKLATLQKTGIGFGTGYEYHQQFVLSAYDRYLRRKPSDDEVAN